MAVEEAGITQDVEPIFVDKWWKNPKRVSLTIVPEMDTGDSLKTLGEFNHKINDINDFNKGFIASKAH